MSKIGDFVVGNQILGQRERQEDDYQIAIVHPENLADPTHVLCVLADGMGGHAGGEEASRVAVGAFVNTYIDSDEPVVDRLDKAMHASNAALAERIQQDPSLNDMGCTLVGVSIVDNELHWISVGDSPLWIQRDNSLKQINQDHSMVPVIEGLVAIGRLTAEEAANDPRRNQLRSALTGEDLSLIDQSHEPYALNEGDVMILASDGLQTISDDEIERLASSSETNRVSLTLNGLLGAVEDKAKPDQDNTTVIVYRHSAEFGDVLKKDNDGEAITLKKDEEN